MHRRCTDPNTAGYHRYGGRGITVCPQWADFEVFLKDMGKRPAGTSLDRERNDGNYEPGNCMWSTRLVQAQNTMQVVVVTANGKSQSISVWARELGVSFNCISARLKRGWSHDRAINTPARTTK